MYAGRILRASRSNPLRLETRNSAGGGVRSARSHYGLSARWMQSRSYATGRKSTMAKMSPQSPLSTQDPEKRIRFLPQRVGYESVLERFVSVSLESMPPPISRLYHIAPSAVAVDTSWTMCGSDVSWAMAGQGKERWWDSGAHTRVQTSTSQQPEQAPTCSPSGHSSS